MSNLVELMAKKYLFAVRNGCNSKGGMRDALSVVKEHIGEVAEVCPECGGDGFSKTSRFVSGQPCPCIYCKGLGLIARTEGDVCLKK